MNVSFDIDELMREVNRRAEKALAAGAVVLNNEVKRTLSTPAPRRMATSRQGVRYPVARTRATRGAPPRLITDNLRGRNSWQVLRLPSGPVGRVGTNVIYGGVHERDGHKFLQPTWQRVQGQVLAAMRRVLGT